MRRPKEGDVFEVELGEGLGKAVGVIARKKGPGHLIYAYLGEPRALRPEDATFVGVVGVQGFNNGSWTLRGPLPGFTREGWPVPPFGRIGEGRNVWKVTLDDSLNTLDEEQVSKEEAEKLTSDDVYGAGAAVIVWRQLARQTEQRRRSAA